MKKNILFLAGLTLLLTNCKTLRVSDFHDTARTPEPLPRMGLLVHQESFAAAFDRETFSKGWNGNVAIPGSSGPFDYFALSDLPLEDVYTALGNEVNENLTNNKGDRYGHIRFRLVHYDRRAPGWGYTIPSALSLNTLNVAGMPYTRYRAELELQVEIADANKKILARYRAPGVGKAYVAMYYGYRRGDAWRKANLLALQDAMNVIRPKIEADLLELKAQLMSAGPLPPTKK
ncbi:MAG: hypothetical protein RIR11_3757 [Bacteroidota bacterium]